MVQQAQSEPARSAPDAALVWLIEDNEFFSSAIQNLLNQTASFHCTAAFSTCEAALAALDTEIAPDVILLDIGLPGMSGIEGIGKLREVLPDVHIVILTVYDDDERVFKALCAGASGYLLKNSPREKIMEAITEVMQGGAPMNMQIARKVLTMFGQLNAPPKHADYGLTAREKEILQHMVNGLTKPEIAEKLFLSYHTVNTHLKNIYSKLQVNTRSGAVSKVFKEKLL